MVLKGLKNGLGYEELNQPGSIVSSLWLTGSIVVDSGVSGSNLHSAEAVTGKNLSLTGSANCVNVVASSTVSGLIVFGKNAVATGSYVGANVVVSDTVSGLVVFGKNSVATGSVVANAQVLAGISTGSPAVKGQLIQTGSITLSAGSIAWAVFGQTFTTIPKVIANYSDIALGSPAGLMNVCGSLASIGSVYLEGATPSKVVDWMAIGGK